MRPTYPEVELALLARWPETKLEPSLDRIRAICELMGDPQHAQAVIHLTGTNGKTTTSRMIDALLRALDLRTGRFTSPHLQRINERICIDGEPLTDEQFVDAYADVAIYADLIDAQQPHRLSFFELLVAMGYAAFADAPVDVAVVEVGMGGAWDATSVADPVVSVVTPIDVDHAKYLGDTPAEVAVEKAGIIKPGGRAVLAAQPDDVLAVLAARAADVGAPIVIEGRDFGIESRVAAVGGQQLTIQGVKGRYEDILLPLHGEFQARNAALALAAVEVFTGDAYLDPDLVRAGFGTVTSPGRMEVVRRSPTIVLDAAHNPHGVAALVESLSEAFSFSPLIGVVGVMADKDAEQILRGLEPVVAHLICTQNSTERSMPAVDLADLAVDLFGENRVSVAPRLDDALEQAILRADASEGFEDALGSGGILVTGSVVTVGEARTLLHRTGDEATPGMRHMCAAMLTLQAIILGLSVPVMITVEDVSPGVAGAIGGGLAVGCLVTAGLLRQPWGYWIGHALQVATILTGVLVPIMFLIGAMFLALWLGAYFLGRRIESDKARWAAAER